MPISPVVETGKLEWELGEGAIPPTVCLSLCCSFPDRCFPNLIFMSSQCRQGAEHNSPLVLWDHGGDEEELQLAQGYSHSNVSLQKKKILAQTL